MNEGNAFEHGIDRSRDLRTAAMRKEGGNYVYDFEPPLSLQELQQNPDYDRVIRNSHVFGGFRNKAALTEADKVHGLIELCVSTGAYEEEVAAFFDSLRRARIADIHLTQESFRSSLETLKPRNATERAIFSLLAKQIPGGRIDARVQADATGKVTAGYALFDRDREVAFAPVTTEGTDTVSILTSLMATRDAYLSEITRGFR